MIPVKRITLSFTDEALFNDSDLKLMMNVIVDRRLFATSADRQAFASKLEDAVGEALGKFEMERL